MVNLTDKFTDAELEWKPQSTGINTSKPWAMVLCYVSARAIQDRLDAVYGVLGWKDTYRFEAKGTVCTLSVWDSKGNYWVNKENGSQETDIESFKGGISSAFKRVAASGFGIGRYLYSLDIVFANCSLEKKQGWNKAKTKDGKWFYWETPTLAPKLTIAEKRQLIDALWLSKDFDSEAFFKAFNIGDVVELKDSQLDQAISGLQAKKNNILPKVIQPKEIAKKTFTNNDLFLDNPENGGI